MERILHLLKGDSCFIARRPLFSSSFRADNDKDNDKEIIMTLGNIHGNTRQTSTSRRSPLLVAFASLALLFGAALAGAEGPGDPAYTETIEVEEVLLDVVVTDDNDQVVLGLEKDDFIVRENGEPVEVRDVTFYSNRQFLGSSERARELGIAPDATPENRYFVLFFHHQDNLLPRLSANLLDAGRRAEQWVRGSLRPNDYVAVVSYFPKFNVQDFTNDEEAILAAIDSAARGTDFEPKALDRPAGLPALGERLPSGDVDRIYEALAMTAEATGAIRARKNLVLFSIGFGEVDTFGFYRPDTRYYPEMIQTLNDNNVAVYPIDLLGSDLSPLFRRNLLDNVLSRMAMETGGEFHANFVSYLTPLEEIAEDNNGYYLVSYAAPEDAQRGEYREVDVEMKNANLDARTREGYVTGEGYP